ncbi:DUF1127 domain-containing protein [Xanthobacter dioxanivorans]|uniref:DUF1127 domain-containing protein n=2 Tax=Xanthobacter dioxanivorans TaxID=2528964 RepID=A0A974PUS7_9HYPH|nr:DUF1127 domain-containing protein [Xanthobacter dioxanivorans]
MLRRRVTEELASLSDRELSDIGISRSDIRRIAHDAAATSGTVATAAPEPAARRPSARPSRSDTGGPEAPVRAGAQARADPGSDADPPRQSSPTTR